MGKPQSKVDRFFRDTRKFNLRKNIDTGAFFKREPHVQALYDAKRSQFCWKDFSAYARDKRLTVFSTECMYAFQLNDFPYDVPVKHLVLWCDRDVSIEQVKKILQNHRFKRYLVYSNCVANKSVKNLFHFQLFTDKLPPTLFLADAYAI